MAKIQLGTIESFGGRGFGFIKTIGGELIHFRKDAYRGGLNAESLEERLEEATGLQISLVAERYPRSSELKRSAAGWVFTEVRGDQERLATWQNRRDELARLQRERQKVSRNPVVGRLTTKELAARLQFACA